MIMNMFGLTIALTCTSQNYNIIFKSVINRSVVSAGLKQIILLKVSYQIPFVKTPAFWFKFCINLYISRIASLRNNERRRWNVLQDGFLRPECRPADEDCQQGEAGKPKALVEWSTNDLGLSETHAAVPRAQYQLQMQISSEMLTVPGTQCQLADDHPTTVIS